MPHPGLTEWVAKQHQGQLIRKTEQPYVEHLLRVAEMAGAYFELGYECGLCHDLVEKTDVTPALLHYYLRQFGYNENEAEIIVAVTLDLTDVFTKSAFPELKKRRRKEKEEQRLITVSPVAQTVKYADLYDNIEWMLKFDPKRSPNYLQRKLALATAMNKGNPLLREKLLDFMNSSLRVDL